MPSPHDQFFWQVFSDPKHVLGELRALLYLRLEHESTGDPWTAFQLLRCVERVLEPFRRQHPRALRLPQIVARFVHHSVSGWRRGTELIDLDDLSRPALSDPRDGDGGRRGATARLLGVRPR